jgi:signal transduction histidine kinase
LGQDAVDAGVDTLGLARMHEQALADLISAHDIPGSRSNMVKRAGGFFSVALIPREQLHRSHRESLSELRTKADGMHAHTQALTAGNRQLKREIARRKAGEEAIKKGKERYYRLLVQSQFMQKKLRHLARQVLSAQEEERREISRELHDEVVQTLVGINVELTALGKGAAVGVKSLKAKIAQTQKLVEKSVTAVHQFARELRPAALDDLGLIPALQAYMKILAARKKIKIRLTAFAGVERLDIGKRTVLFRVAQESLTNVARHANASLVTVTISKIAGGIRMQIHDNGRSFQVLQTLSSKTNKRLGLLGMRERVEMIGGTLSIESAVGHGTMVRAEVPFVAEEKL